MLLSREAAKPDAEEAPGVLEEEEEGAPRGRAAESDDEVAPPKGSSPPPPRLLRRHSSSASSSMDELSCASVTSSPLANKEQVMEACRLACMTGILATWQAVQ